MLKKARAFLELTKPGITLFVGITSGAAFITALDGWALPARLGLMLVATMLTSGGAATLNQVHERSHDALMRRTAARPLPSGIITVAAARAFGWGLSLTGVALAVAFLPWATTLFLALSHASYVYAYTPLKRKTPLCTLIGAIPGALPVLVGWTASGEPVNIAALALTGVLFMWQIPHFLAIAWVALDDYRRAGCPMLGVVDPSGRASARVSMAYACAMLVCAIVVGVTTSAGIAYLLAALVAGTVYSGFAWLFLRQRQRSPALRLFFSSLIVLPLLLTALVADILLLH